MCNLHMMCRYRSTLELSKELRIMPHDIEVPFEGYKYADISQVDN